MFEQTNYLFELFSKSMMSHLLTLLASSEYRHKTPTLRLYQIICY